MQPNPLQIVALWLLAVLLCAALLVGCNSQPPTPFVAGEITHPPLGCTRLRLERIDADC